jgi:hypothetical protein
MPLSKPSVALVFVPSLRFGLLPSLFVAAVIGIDHTDAADAGSITPPTRSNARIAAKPRVFATFPICTLLALLLFLRVLIPEPMNQVSTG